MYFLTREGWRVVWWPITAIQGNSHTRSATGSVVLMENGHHWDCPVAGLYPGPVAKVTFLFSRILTCVLPRLLDTILSPCHTQTWCVRVSCSWTMVTFGPGISGSQLEWRRVFPAIVVSPFTGQKIETARCLENGPAPLQSVAIMVRKQCKDCSLHIYAVGGKWCVTV